MKKIALVITVLFIGTLLLVSSAQAGSLIGWQGSAQVIYDCSAPHECNYVTNGNIAQTIAVAPGNYALDVFCIGNGIFSITQDGVTTSAQCSNAATWTAIWIQNQVITSSPLTVRLSMGTGDKFDAVCMMQADGGCPPSPFANFSFEQDYAAPTPTCIPKGKSGKCK